MILSEPCEPFISLFVEFHFLNNLPGTIEFYISPNFKFFSFLAGQIILKLFQTLVFLIDRSIPEKTKANKLVRISIFTQTIPHFIRENSTQHINHDMKWHPKNTLIGIEKLSQTIKLVIHQNQMSILLKPFRIPFLN